ncbi:MAG: hypothetical protein ABIH86_05440 [Planctomycetota bacterium]
MNSSVRSITRWFLALIIIAPSFAVAAVVPQKKPIAKVFGRAITEDDLVAETNRLIKIEVMRGTIKRTDVDMDIIQAKQNDALMNLMQLELKRHFLSKRNITVSKEELDELIKNRDSESKRVLNVSLQQQVEETENFETWKDRQAIDLGMFKYAQMAIQENPNEVYENYCKIHNEKLPFRRFRYIVVTYGQEDGRGGINRSEAEARKIIDSARSDIVSGKVSFSEKAMEISEQMMYFVGGLMYFVSKDGKTVYDPSRGNVNNMPIPDEIREELYKLEKVDDVSPVFKARKDPKSNAPASSGAFQIIQVTDIRTPQSFSANIQEIVEWIIESRIDLLITEAKSSGNPDDWWMEKSAK